jgi:hypothetical protein
MIYALIWLNPKALHYRLSRGLYHDRNYDSSVNKLGALFTDYARVVIYVGHLYSTGR